MNPLALIRRVARVLSIEGWIVVAFVGLLLALAAAIWAAGRDHERDAQAGRTAAAEARAAAGRETAATERTLDGQANAAREKERELETAQVPDRRPDPDQLPHLCGELRRHGVDVSGVAECRGFAP